MNSIRKMQKRSSVIKLTPRAELERKKAKPLTKVLEELDVEQVTCSCMLHRFIRVHSKQMECGLN
jgi:hypothetical protein